MGPRTKPDKRDHAAREVLAGGRSPAEVARELGVQPSTVWHWARKYADEHGLPRPKSQRAPERRHSKADELLAGVTTQEELIERLKAHRSAARERAKPSRQPSPQTEQPPRQTRIRVSYEAQQLAVKQYLQKKAGARDLATRHGVSVTTIHYWVRGYRAERGLF